MKLKKDRSKLVAFKGGPFDGQSVRLSGDATRQTLQFTAKGQTGSYQQHGGYDSDIMHWETT